MTGLLIAIGLLVLGYFFLKHYESIDMFVCLLGSDEEYEPFGRWPVYTCTLLGAVNGCVFAWTQFFHKNTDIEPVVTSTVYALAIMACAAGVYEAFFKLYSPWAVLRKSLLLVFSCAFGMMTGAFASIAVICVLVLLLGLKVFSWMLGAESKTGQKEPTQTRIMHMEDGDIREVEDISNGQGQLFRDRQGDVWEHGGLGRMRNQRTGEESTGQPH